jgi:formate dehydrogenase subunit gamma
MSGSTIARPTVVTGDEQIERYTFKERAYHWVNAIAYSYLLLSGLALFTPYLWWVAAVLGGGGTIRFWHPWLGLIYFVTVLGMQSMWKRDMNKIPQDEQWSKNIKAYVTQHDEAMPPQGRFNAGQKQFWWIMYYGTYILLVTGIIMWFPERIPSTIHWLLPITVFIHSLTALITIGAFILHVYMSVWVTPGSTKAMIEGDVSAAWARTHHRLWYEKITGRKS